MMMKKDGRCWKSRRNRRAGDTEGAVEGMPLQLIIMVIVSVMVLGIISGWIYIMSDTETVIDEIIVEPDVIRLVGDTAELVQISVIDTEGDLVKNCVIVLEGCGIENVTELHRGEGVISLEGLDLPYNRPSGYLSITATRSGMGCATRDIVVFRVI